VVPGVVAVVTIVVGVRLVNENRNVKVLDEH
jgi:hypothetical protein